MGLVQRVQGGPACSLCFSLVHFISAPTCVARCGQEEKMVRGPPCSLVNTQICFVVLHGMCFYQFCPWKRELSDSVHTYLSVRRASNADTGLRALVHSVPLAYSAPLPPSTSGSQTSPKPLSMLLLLRISLTVLDLGLLAVR